MGQSKLTQTEKMQTKR